MPAKRPGDAPFEWSELEHAVGLLARGLDRLTARYPGETAKLSKDFAGFDRMAREQASLLKRWKARLAKD